MSSGPLREREGRLRETTREEEGSQVTPAQEQGVTSAGFQERRAPAGREGSKEREQRREGMEDGGWGREKGA